MKQAIIMSSIFLLSVLTAPWLQRCIHPQRYKAIQNHLGPVIWMLIK
jgi:hypothetical protein